MRGSSIRRGINRDWLTFGILALCLYLRVFFAGIRYYPVLDDFIQYGCFPLYENVGAEVIGKIGLLSKRPLAGIFDIFVWGRMWNNMALALFLIITMYVIMLFLLYKAFEMDKVKNSIFFPVFAGLTPLMDEGLYWISSSSRLVVGMFLGSIACYMLYLSLKNYEKKYIPYVLALTTVSFCFYEQVVPAVVLLLYMIFYKYRNNTQSKKLWLIPVIALVFIGAYYIIAGHFFAGDMRVSEGLGFSFGAILEGLGQFFEILFGVHRQYLTYTFLQGFRAIFENGGWIYFVLVTGASAAMGYAAYISYEPKYIMNSKNENTTAFLLAGGVVLIFGSLSPNLLVSPAWICLRNVFVPVLGIGFLWLLFGKTIQIPRLISALLVFVMTFVFSVSGIGDINIYKTVSQYDVRLCTQIADLIEKDALARSGDKETVVIINSSFYEEMKPYYKDHVKSVTYTDWALTGGVRAMAGNVKIATVTPVGDGAKIEDTNKLILLAKEDGVVPLSLKNQNLILPDGAVAAKIVNNVIIIE